MSALSLSSSSIDPENDATFSNEKSVSTPSDDGHRREETRDELVLHVRQCIGPASPIQKSGKNGTTIELDGFSIHGVVGRGKFSTVYLATRKSDGLTVALKKIKLGVGEESRVRQKCLREVQLLQSLDHPNIIRYLDSFLAHPGSLGIVLEWATAGDLRKHIGNIRARGVKLPEPVIWKSFIQICNALAHMHEKRVLHRDLKPANIFLMKDGSLKVGDLGLGRTLSDDTPEAFSKVGTPLYMSPESLKGEPYDEKSDIWSLGCILYEMAMLRSPFKEPGLKMFQLFEIIVKGTYPPIPESAFSSFLIKLVGLMLSVNPADRPDVLRARTIAMLSLTECINTGVQTLSKMGTVPVMASYKPQAYPRKKSLSSSLGESVSRHFASTGNHESDLSSNSSCGGGASSYRSNSNSSAGSSGAGSDRSQKNAIWDSPNLTQREKDLMRRAYLVGSESSKSMKDVTVAWKVVEEAAEKFAAKSAAEDTTALGGPGAPLHPSENTSNVPLKSLMKKTSPIAISKKHPMPHKLYQEPLLQTFTPTGPKKHLGRKKMGSPPILPPLGGMEKGPAANLATFNTFPAERESFGLHDRPVKSKKGVVSSFADMAI
jgi:NIMA (never in mitosis gene a)-related kinase